VEPASEDSPAREVILRRKQQHPRPLAPGLSRRPCSAAYGPGPSVFTIRAKKMSTDRASVSQAVACRGTPPLPPMSLGACRRCGCGGTAGRTPDGACLGKNPLPAVVDFGSSTLDVGLAEPWGGRKTWTRVKRAHREGSEGRVPRCRAIRMARRSASTRLRGLAVPFPAMSNAVP